MYPRNKRSQEVSHKMGSEIGIEKYDLVDKIIKRKNRYEGKIEGLSLEKFEPLFRMSHTFKQIPFSEETN